jgi:hypothetical protein
MFEHFEPLRTDAKFKLREPGGVCMILTEVPIVVSRNSRSPPDVHLPMIWDADFMLGPPGADGADSYVLGEINVSSVFPIPAEAPAEIASRVADRLRSNL